MRIYTINEISSMRESVRDLLMPWSQLYIAPSDSQIEDQLRTYMLGNVEPDVLRRKSQKAMADRQEFLRYPGANATSARKTQPPRFEGG